MQHSGPECRILFVCLGNICRSPLAEGIMQSLAGTAGVPVDADSAGTGDWHIGAQPDPRSIAVASAHGLDISRQRGRQIGLSDFAAFDHIVALDRANLRTLGAMRPKTSAARLSLLLDHVPGRSGQDVADPYTGDRAAFETAWNDIHAGVTGLLAGIISTDGFR
jgi:protein-tyrosine phosphatase